MKRGSSQRGRSSRGFSGNDSLQLLASASESAKKRVPRFDDFELMGFNSALDQSGIIYGGDGNGLNVSNFSDMSAVFSIDGPSPSPIAGDVDGFVNDTSPNFEIGELCLKYILYYVIIINQSTHFF